MDIKDFARQVNRKHIADYMNNLEASVQQYDKSDGSDRAIVKALMNYSDKKAYGNLREALIDSLLNNEEVLGQIDSRHMDDYILSSIPAAARTLNSIIQSEPALELQRFFANMAEQEKQETQAAMQAQQEKNDQATKVIQQESQNVQQAADTIKQNNDSIREQLMSLGDLLKEEKETVSDKAEQTMQQINPEMAQASAVPDTTTGQGTPPAPEAQPEPPQEPNPAPSPNMGGQPPAPGPAPSPAPDMGSQPPAGGPSPDDGMFTPPPEMLQGIQGY